MSVNLVDLVLQQVGGNVPGILGSLLGENADRTQKAVAGAVPAILGGLMGLASKGEEGIAQLKVAAEYQGDGLLDDLTGVLSGGQHRNVIDQGSNMLASLLGDGVIGTLVGAIGKFSGLGSGSSKSLLGLATPIVLAVLNRQTKERGLDSSGLANLLMSQKDNIQAAMPSGLSSALGSAGSLDDLMGTAQSTAASIGEAVNTAAGKVGEAAGQAAVAVGGAAESASAGASDVSDRASAAAAGASQSSGSWLRWLLPLVILLALLWLAFTFLGGGDVEQTASDAGDAVNSAVEATSETAGDAADAAADATDEAATDAGNAAETAVATASETADEAATAATAASDAADDAGNAASSAADSATAMVGDIDVGSTLTSTFDGLTETLSNISDEASARLALPTLEEMSNGLDDLTGLADQLPDAAAGGISELVDNGLSAVDSAMNSLEDLPGVSEVITPVIDEIKEKLSAFSTA